LVVEANATYDVDVLQVSHQCDVGSVFKPWLEKMMSEIDPAPGLISPEEYSRLATRPTHGNGYSRLPPALVRAERSLDRAGRDVASANRMLCHSLLAAFRTGDSPWRLSGVFDALYQVQLRRIESALENKDDTYFSLGHDPFLKDLAILRHRLIPFGAELATPYSEVSRRLLLGGWHQALAFMKIIFASGGREPFLELHMHPDCTGSFTPSGWLDTYDNLADFLAANPSLRGVQSTSWFLDPALARVSPHLAYLRQVPEHCGAVFFNAGPDNPCTTGAFATSKTRRELHARGLYMPWRYTRIWPRQALLARQWRQQQ